MSQITFIGPAFVVFDRPGFDKLDHRAGAAGDWR